MGDLGISITDGDFFLICSSGILFLSVISNIGLWSGFDIGLCFDI